MDHTLRGLRVGRDTRDEASRKRQHQGATNEFLHDGHFTIHAMTFPGGLIAEHSSFKLTASGPALQEEAGSTYESLGDAVGRMRL